MGKYKKSFKDRCEELRQALYRIEEAIDRYKQNSEIAELGSIAIELRGLLFSEALFISLCRERNFPLELYIRPTALRWELDSYMRTVFTHVWSEDLISLTYEKP